MNQPPPQIPASFEEALPRLALRLHGHIPHAILRAELETRGAGPAAPATRPVAGEVHAGAVLDAGDSWIPVSEQLLGAWGVDVTTVVDAAHRRSFGQEFEGTRGLGKGTYVLQDEQFCGSVLVQPSMLSGFPVEGATVVLPVTHGEVLVTGSHDLEGLKRIAQIGERLADLGEALVSVVPLVVDASERWSIFEWPGESALQHTVARLNRLFAASCYRRQAATLAGGTAHVAETKAFEAPDGRTVLVATVTEGVETLLPVVDDVVLVALDGRARPIQFPDFLEATGGRVTETGLVPRRFHVPADVRI